VSAFAGVLPGAPDAGATYPAAMGNKSTPSSSPKKPSRSLKEKRAAKHAKQEQQKDDRKGWNAK
jgi:hypothetical protein